MHNSNTGSHWTSSLLFSLVQELVPSWNAEADTFDGTGFVLPLDKADHAIAEQATTVVTRYNDFVKRVEVLELPACIDDKPILNVRDTIRSQLHLFILSTGKGGCNYLGCKQTRALDWRSTGEGLRMGSRQPKGHKGRVRGMAEGGAGSG